MNNALVTWKHPITRTRYVIGELTYINKQYIFKYYDKSKLEKALEAGFDRIGEFFDLEKEYVNDGLFLTFATRIPSRKRIDFQKFLEENQIEKNASDFEILMSTRGFLETDTIELFKKIDFSKDEIECFLVGTRHYVTPENPNLDENMKLDIVLESENNYDEFAVYIINEHREKLGYIPIMYSENITKWLKKNNYSVELKKLIRLKTEKRVELFIKIKKNNII